jgi:hypothetical protein
VEISKTAVVRAVLTSKEQYASEPVSSSSGTAFDHQVSPQVVAESTLAHMKLARRWLCWALVPGPQGSKAKKIPYYVDGTPRGKTDTSEDLSKLATYEEACAAVYAGNGRFTSPAFALGPDGKGGYWQGIDFDDVAVNGLENLVEQAPGYVEVSPSKLGAHAIGYGLHFDTLGSNGSGVEAYAGARYFTFTGEMLRDSVLTCLAAYVVEQVVLVHGAVKAASSAAQNHIYVTHRTVTELRSALVYLRADDRGLWVRIGHALKELGEQGRGLWLDWSSTSSKFDPADASKTWESFKPTSTDYKAVFAEAQRQGWTNPSSNAARLATSSDVVNFSQRAPRDILRHLPPEPFDLAEAPPPISSLALAFSRATGFDRSGVIVAATTAAASMIDDRYRLEVNKGSDWIVSARQWAFLCAPPSGGKSPTLRTATDPIKRMHIEMRKLWVAQNADLPPHERSPMPALFTSDATVAALSELLKDNPGGLLVLNEEFSSWAGAIDCADRGDAAKNRGDWLQLRDGGARQIDRIARGSVQVENWGASVLAACTPDGIAKQMKVMPEDGLIQRFVPCIMSAPDLDALGDCSKEIQEWAQGLRWAYEFTTARQGTVVRMSSKAREMFEAERRGQRQLVMDTEVFAPAYAAHLGKHPGMLAEIALTFHVFSGREPTVELEAETMAIAIRYMRRVRKHSYYLYSTILSGSPGFELAQALARSIVASDPPVPAIGREFMTQHCQLFKKSDDRVRREAVQFLEDADWLQASGEARGYGGWPTKYEVNPHVYEMFAREGEQWRARRAAVKEAIERGE